MRERDSTKQIRTKINDLNDKNEAAGECKFAFAATLGFTDATFHALFLGGTAPTGAADPLYICPSTHFSRSHRGLCRAHLRPLLNGACP